MTGDGREKLARMLACFVEAVAVTVERHGGLDENGDIDDDAHDIVHAFTGRLEDMLERPSGVDLVLWEGELEDADQ